MKPYRVKRDGKLIGSFIVVHDGRRVNLQTKDASEARRRAALVERGKWPEEDASAARAVKEALEGAPPVPSSIPSSENQPAAPPLKSNSSPPLPEAKPAADTTQTVPAAGSSPPSQAADAVNATAAAAADEAAKLDAEAKAALANAGVDLSELQAKAPEFLGKVHVWLQGHALRIPIRIVKGKWPPFADLGDDGAELRNLIGKLWATKLAALDLDVSRITPGWWLLILSGMTAFAQAAAMLEAMRVEVEEETKQDTVGPKDD